jgi:hypothetical protein
MVIIRLSYTSRLIFYLCLLLSCLFFEKSLFLSFVFVFCSTQVRIVNYAIGIRSILYV